MSADAGESSGIIENETGAQRTLGYVLDVGQGDGCARCRLTVGGGRSLVFVDGTLEDATGRTIATASGVFKRVPPARLADA